MPVSGVSQYIVHFSFLGIFIWFALIEQVTPIPEEVSLVTVGYVCRHAGIHPLIAGLASLLGLLAADALFYLMAHKGARWINKVLDRFGKAPLEHYRERIRLRPVRTLLIMALLPKLRFLSPILSATVGISWGLFITVNAIATLFYVSTYIILGTLFHDQLAALFRELELLRHLLFAAIILFIGWLLIIKVEKMTR